VNNTRLICKHETQCSHQMEKITMSLSELSSQVVTVECAVNTCSCVVSLISGVLFINEYHVLKIHNHYFKECSCQTVCEFIATTFTGAETNHQ